jgi:hypothetical protein
MVLFSDSHNLDFRVCTKAGNHYSLLFFFFFFFFFFFIKTHQSEVKKRRKGKRPGLEPDGCGEG